MSGSILGSEVNIFHTFVIMKLIKKILFVLALGLTTLVSSPVSVNAQCAMCSLTAQNATENGNTQGKGLNNAILFLLAMPYLAAAGIGFLWYKKYRPKKKVRMDEGPISLN